MYNERIYSLLNIITNNIGRWIIISLRNIPGYSLMWTNKFADVLYSIHRLAWLVAGLKNCIGKKSRQLRDDPSAKSKGDFLAAECRRAFPHSPAMLRANFPVEKQPLCLHAGRQSFYFGECMYADLCGLPRARGRKGQPKKAQRPGLSHVQNRRGRSVLPASRWGRCLTMRTVKRWHISMAINIRIKGRRDTGCAECAREIDVTHNNSSPSLCESTRSLGKFIDHWYFVNVQDR